MHIHFADPFYEQKSVIHNLDPRTKVALTLLFILVVSLVPFGAFGRFFLCWLWLVATAVLARVGILFLIKRSFVALPFAIAAITLPFTIPGETLFSLPIFGGVDISQEGTVRFASIMLKSFISVQMAILLVTVTPFPRLLWGLRALRIPQPIIAIISFMYRYLFVLSDEALRLIRARSARSAGIEGQRSGGSLLWRGKVAGRMAGSLMLRSFERSERIYNAMIARGYKGQIISLHHSHFHNNDYYAWVANILFLGFVLWWPL